MPIKPRFLVLLVACCMGAALLTSQAAHSQASLIDGYWLMLANQDSFAYVPGPDAGDYSGLPMTPAAVSFAHQWSPEQITLPLMQCNPYNVTYSFRGLGLLRIWEDRDPYTQAETQIESWQDFGAQHRHIWVAPHPHPPTWAPHSFEGYSTGKWVGNVLWVHTDMLKPISTRGGQPFSDRTTMDERFFRYDDLLVDVLMISDAQYLTQPYVYSKMYSHVAEGVMAPYLCTPNDEIPRAQGLVPMHLPGNGEKFIDGPVRRGVPLQAALGGPATMDPQYQDYMKTLPPNPPFQVVDKAEQQASAQDQPQK